MLVATNIVMICQQRCGVLMQVQPGQSEVMPVELQGLSVVMQVKVSIAQLTVDGA